MKIKDQKNFWSGVMFIVFGGFFAGYAQQYGMGTAARMGPAYFPTLLGGLMIVLGLFIGFQGLTITPTGEDDGKVEKFHFKPLLLVLASVCAFGFLLRPAGLLIATVAMVVISSLGSHEFRWRGVLVLSAVLAAMMVGIFYYGLKMTIPILPAIFD